jgi:hypothetical protein
MHELETHYDMQIDQIYEQNDDTAADQSDGKANRLHDNP